MRVPNAIARSVTAIMPDRCGAMVMLRCPLDAMRSSDRVDVAVKDRGQRHQQRKTDGHPTQHFEVERMSHWAAQF